MAKITSHKDLRVYQRSFDLGMRVFEITKRFPNDEKYSLSDQVRRSARSVSGNIAEAWRKRRYPKSFVAKLTDSEGEAAETQVWLDYALACGYMDEETHSSMVNEYDQLLGMLVTMIINPDKWSL